MKELAEKLKQQGEMNFLEGATKSQIETFEQDHQVELPTKFKEWLLFSDGGDFFLPAGIQIYGVTHKPIIDVNNNDRPDDTYLVIGALSTGDPILCQKDSEKISLFDHEESVIDEDFVFDDFSAFLSFLPNLVDIGD